jgi:hypothetical protein
MFNHRWAMILAVVCYAIAASAGEQTRPMCATSAETNESQDRLARWVDAKRRAHAQHDPQYPAGLFGGPVRFENNMFIMQTDASITPFDRPVDLQNSSLYFTRIDANRFNVERTALVYDNSVALWTSFNSTPTYATRALSFNFPFYGSGYSSVNVTSTKGLYFATPPATNFAQYDALKAVYQRIPVISPLLESTSENWGPYDVYVREVPGVSITFNWRRPFEDVDTNQDLQVTLFSNGDIRLSYKTVGKAAWGAFVVTSGTEPFYASRSVVTSAGDAAGDVNAAVPVAIRPMVDQRTLTLQRVGGSDLLELQLTVDGPINPGLLAGGSEVIYYFQLGATSEERSQNTVYAILHSDGTVESFHPGGQWTTNSPAVSIAGSTIRIQFPEDRLALGSLHTQMDFYTAYTAANYQGDSATATFTLDAPARLVATDFSALTGPAQLHGPIVEAFTLPTLNTQEVWNRLKAAYGFTDAEVDQVAIYQNFFTDIIHYAGAFSTVGNSGDDGVRADFNGSAFPRAPALLHMNTLNYGWNSSPEGRLAVRTHEFGHRWLYFVKIMENGSPASSLNPQGGHPKKGVHTPAAFSAVTSQDSSAMGGGIFTQTGPSTYKTAQDTTYYGFSWHELYLMGLASSGEVPSWFYLNGAGLEESYWPNTNWTYNVTSRTNVSQQQLVDALGPRNPSYATSQKMFREAVVILERPGEPLSPAASSQYSTQLVNNYQNHFSAITGGRGSVAIVTPLVNQPLNLVATATSAASVNVSWTAVAGASSYQVWRSSNNSAFAQVATAFTNSFNDGVSPNTTYLYKVRSVDGGSNLSPFSGTDLATTVIFTDDPLVAASTRIKATHMSEVRSAVNAVRAAAGMPAVSFTNPSVTQTAIRAAHILELRVALDAALNALGAPPIVGASSIFAGGTVVVKARDVQSLRDAIR